MTLASAPCNAIRTPSVRQPATCAFGAGAATRTRNLLFRRCVPTVRQGWASAVLAGHVGRRIGASSATFGLVTAGGMTPRMTAERADGSTGRQRVLGPDCRRRVSGAAGRPAGLPDAWPRGDRGSRKPLCKSALSSTLAMRTAMLLANCIWQIGPILRLPLSVS